LGSRYGEFEVSLGQDGAIVFLNLKNPFVGFTSHFFLSPDCENLLEKKKKKKKKTLMLTKHFQCFYFGSNFSHCGATTKIWKFFKCKFAKKG